jgi:O-antigen/teichoic acid export membrane protein
MGIVHKEGLSSTIISYAGIAIGFVNIALLFPKYFEPQDLGLRSVLTEFSIILSQFAMLGFGTVANKYFPYFQTKEGSHHNGFLFLILGVPLIGFIITSVLCAIR